MLTLDEALHLFISFFPPKQFYDIGIIIPILQKRKLRLKEVKYQAQA